MRVRRRPSINTKELQENWQPLLYVRVGIVVVLAAYVIAFIIENRKSVSVHFVLATARVSLVWLILLSLALGFVAGILLSQLERRRRRRRAAKQAG
ncbi:MAG TPA: LapA family protein [Gaiellaceae bacterium]